MGAFIARRSLRMLVILALASVAVFYSLRFAPGDPSGVALSPLALAEAREAYRHRLGLDLPIFTQYVVYLSNLAHGDLGSSLVTGKPIGDLLGYYGRNSLVLGAAAFAITYLVGIPLGVLAAAKRNTWIDNVASSIAVIGMGMPNFWLALLLIWLFSARLRLLPSAGCCGPVHLILPAVVLAAEGTAVTMRMMRSSMLEQLGLDFVRTHRAKGLKERVIVGNRVFRNALLPIVSLSGLRLGWLVGYALIVETIFQWPGVGYLLVDSVLRRDYPVAQFFSLVLVLVVVLANFLADLAYGVVDPRIRHA
ncbi:MAG TPA: ABC transporter permease [Thermomicrobiales bacterium]|nr:ABC transporter permease [Thermomicrobiales bacterium]